MFVTPPSPDPPARWPGALTWSTSEHIATVFDIKRRSVLTSRGLHLRRGSNDDDDAAAGHRWIKLTCTTQEDGNKLGHKSSDGGGCSIM